MLRLDDVPAMTAAEAAEILGVTPRHVRRLVAAGRLTAVQVGRCWLIDVRDVARYATDRGWCNRYGVKGGSRA